MKNVKSPDWRMTQHFFWVTQKLLLRQLRSTLERFHCYSGLKINKEKTIIIPLGINRKKVIKLPKELQKLTVNYNAFKTLGIWFSSDEEKMVKLNFENRIKKIENLLNIWTSRNLSLKGKVIIIKTMVLPQVTHLFCTCFCPKQILDQVDKIIFNFLWNKKPHKIKRGTMIANSGDVGLGMPDIYVLDTK